MVDEVEKKKSKMFNKNVPGKKKKRGTHKSRSK